MKRKSPVRHKVHKHLREGKVINSFIRGKGTKQTRIQKKKIIKKSVQKSLIKGVEFVRILKEEVKNNPAIRGANYDIVRANVCRKLNLSKKEFDEILGYMIGTDKIQGVWLFTGGGQAKIYHRNMQGHIFDSIDEMGERIQHYKEPQKPSSSGKRTKIKMNQSFSAGRSAPVSEGDILEVIRFMKNGDAIVWVDKMPSVWQEMRYKIKPAKRMRVQIPSYMFEEDKQT